MSCCRYAYSSHSPSVLKQTQDRKVRSMLRALCREEKQRGALPRHDFCERVLKKPQRKLRLEKHFRKLGAGAPTKSVHLLLERVRFDHNHHLYLTPITISRLVSSRPFFATSNHSAGRSSASATLAIHLKSPTNSCSTNTDSRPSTRPYTQGPQVAERIAAAYRTRTHPTASRIATARLPSLFHQLWIHQRNLRRLLQKPRRLLRLPRHL